jgi:hypothetical protein
MKLSEKRVDKIKNKTKENEWLDQNVCRGRGRANRLQIQQDYMVTTPPTEMYT